MALKFRDLITPRSDLESKLEKDVCRHFVADFIAIKFGDGSRTGAPDRLFIAPKGQVIFAEFKAPGEEPNPSQQYYHNVLRGLGHAVFVFDNYDNAVAVLSQFTLASKADSKLMPGTKKTDPKDLN